MWLLRILSRLPFSVLYGISNFLFVASHYVVRYRRGLVRTNLANSFPEKTIDELRSIEKNFYRNLCDYGVETLKLLTIPKEELASRMRFVNVEVMEEHRSKNEPVILLAAHLFNWEWLLTAGTFSLPQPVDFVYQKVNSELFNQFSLICRTRFGAYAIERSVVAKETLRRKTVNRAIAIVADQYPGHRSDKKHPVPFLNQETVFFLGANQLAVMTQYPVYFINIRKMSRGFYEASFDRISIPPYGKDDTTIVEEYAKAVEAAIVKDPSNWLWSHNRWKKRHLQNAPVQSLS